MPNEKWNKEMLSAVAESLENMAFIEVLPAEPDSEPPSDPVWVSLLVLDPTQGEFHLVLSRTLLDEISANIYGPGAEVTEQQSSDLLAELLNTILGRFMGAILPKETFKLGIPKKGSTEMPAIEPDAIQWRFVTDEEYILQIIASGAPLLQLYHSDQ